MIRVIVVDDQQLVRRGFCSILEQADDIQVVGEGSDGESAFRLVEKLSPDVVLMDVHMPGIGGIEATRMIRRRFPGVQVVAVTAVSDEPFPGKLHDAGALGFVSKGCDAADLQDAVRAAAQSRPFWSRDVAQRLAHLKFVSGGETSLFAALTARELQVALMIARGMNNKDIQEQLFLSPKTVSTYRHRIFEKLEVENDVQLAHLALRHGIVELR